MSDAADGPDESPDEPTDDTAAGTTAASVATGILASARAAQTEIDRRRRWLVGGAVLGLVVVGAIVVARTLVQADANRDATEAAARTDALTAYATELIEQAESYEPPTMAIAEEVEPLLVALQDELQITQRTDDELDAARTAAIEQLRASAATIAELVERPVPDAPDLVGDQDALTVLERLEALRAEATALHEEVAAVTAAAEDWVAAIDRVTVAMDAHLAVVAAEPDTSDRTELIELWEAERPSLLRLRGTARGVDEPGLEAWAAAHLAYAESMLAWIDEAVGLLEDGEVDAYNERFRAIFAAGDPFGLAAAVGNAVPEALRSEVLSDAELLLTRTMIVLDAVMALEVTAGEVLTVE